MTITQRSISRFALPNAFPMLLEWAQAQESVRAVLLTSTRAIPTAAIDIFSDYDVILTVRDIHPWVADHAWLDHFGEVLVAYWDPIHHYSFLGIEVCSNVVQYASGLKIDFTLWPVSLLQHIVQSSALPSELDAGYRVLLDKDQLTDAMLAPTGRAYIPKAPTQVEFQAWVNDFLSDAPYVAKCLKRDELMPAKWCLDYDMKQVYLRRVLEWRVQLDHHWSLPVGSLGKGLKKSLPQAIWATLEHTFSGADIGANWSALEHTLQLFRQVATEVGLSLGYHYPEELHSTVVAYIEHIRNL